MDIEPQLLDDEELDLAEPVNFTVLFKSISDRNWTSAIRRLETDPIEAEIWTMSKPVRGEISWLRLPLHEACIRVAPSSVVKALLNVYPNGAMGKDATGRIPLHHAAIHGACPETISLLLEAFPSSADSKDSFNKTPIMCLKPSFQYNLVGDIGARNLVLEILSRHPTSHQKAAELRNKLERLDKLEEVKIERHKEEKQRVQDLTNEEKHRVHELEEELAKEIENKTSIANDLEKIKKEKKEIESSLHVNKAIMFRIKAEKARSQAEVTRLEEEKDELEEKYEDANNRCQQVEAEYIRQSRDMLALNSMLSSLQENFYRVKDHSLKIKNRYVNNKIDFRSEEKESLTGDWFSYSQDKPTFIKIINYDDDFDASTDISVGDSSTISSLRAKVRGHESQVSLALKRAKLHSR